MTPYLEISFRRGRPFAAYLHCSTPRPAASSRQIGVGLVVDLAADGAVLGVEITDPQHTAATAVAAALAPLGVDVTLLDLAPLAA
jgi:hypothetical protein